MLLADLIVYTQSLYYVILCVLDKQSMEVPLAHGLLLSQLQERLLVLSFLNPELLSQHLR